MIKLFNFRPILFLALSFTAGIFFASVTSLGVWSIVIPILVILFISGVHFLLSKEYRTIYYGILFSLVFVLGFIFFYHTVVNSKNVAKPYTTYTVTGEIKECYDYKDGRYMLTVGDLCLNGEDINGYTARVITKTEGLKKHDLISFSSSFYDVELSIKNVEYIKNKTCLIANEYVEVERIGNNSNLFNNISRLAEERLLEYVPEGQSGVLIALVLGDTSHIDRELLTKYRMAGIAHIFAVSGLHIGFFCAMFAYLFDKLWLKRFYNAILVFLIGLFYAGVCDFSVSALRALFMYFINKIASSFGRKYDFLNSIFLSMIIVLLIFPESLFSYGFLLSYLAVISIALFGRQFTNLFAKLPKSIASKFGVSLAVVMGTLPVIIPMLGEVSLITVILNVIFLPIVSVVYYFTFIGTIVVMIFPHFNAFLFIGNVLTYFINDIMLNISFDRFLIKFNASKILLIPYSINIILLSDKVNLSKKIRKCVYLILPFSVLLLI